jgi:hypothetical protein
MSKFHLYCSCTLCQLKLTVQNLESHFETHSRSQHSCGNPECTELTSTKFCSKKCSGIVSNKNRSRESYQKIQKSVRCPKIKLPKPIKQRICVCCGKVDLTTGHFQSDKCSFCNDSLTYRRQCEFKFNLKDYPNEFDFKLLTEHGMFSPQKNPKGISRDHMVSVQYGKENRIDPKIISHPANCKLMLQGDNTRKQSESSITYEELIERIQVWDNKYN